MYQSSPYLFVRADGIRLSLLVLWYTSLSNREDLPMEQSVGCAEEPPKLSRESSNLSCSAITP